jgi:hypothetical protein
MAKIKSMKDKYIDKITDKSVIKRMKMSVINGGVIMVDDHKNLKRMPMGLFYVLLRKQEFSML